MSSDREPASSDSDGAMRMPPTAARAQPRAQLSRAMRLGRAPFRRVSERSSTLARMDTPMRVRRSRKRSPTATAMATTMVMACW